MKANQLTWALVGILSLSLTGVISGLAQENDRQQQREQRRQQQQRDLQGQPRPDQRPPGRFAPQRPMAGAPGIARMFAVLTPEQRQSLRGVMQSNPERNRQNEQKLNEARRALLESALGENFNERQAREHANTIARIEAERLVEMAKTLSQVDPPLSPDQIRQLRNPAPMMRDQGRPALPERPDAPPARERNNPEREQRRERGS